MKAKRVVAILLFALLVYFGLIGYRGVYLIEQSALDLKVLGLATLVLPFIGVYVVVAELRFGMATERLGRQLRDDDSVARFDDELARRPSGRVDREAADARFGVRAAEVEAAPDDWQRWFRLAQAYDEAGDRKRARAAMRTAIERADPST